MSTPSWSTPSTTFRRSSTSRTNRRLRDANAAPAPAPDTAEDPSPRPPHDEISLSLAAKGLERSRDLYTKGFVSKAQLDQSVRRYEALKAREGAEKPEDPTARPQYDAYSLALAAERMEWSRKMHAKGFVSKAQLESDVRAFELLKTRIDADIAEAAERAEWARQMFEKGYVTKRQYDLAILKHYDALKARMLGVRSSRTGESQAVTDELLKDYESFKELLWYAQHQQDPAAESAPGTPGTKPPAPPEKPKGDPRRVD